MGTNPAHRLKVNLFGESEWLAKVALPENDIAKYRALASKLNQPLCTALCDPFFFYKFGNKKVTSLIDLKTVTIYSGLRNTPKNQIEVWYAGKKVLKIRMDDLLNELVLFPLFNVLRNPITNISNNGIYFRQQEVGLIGCYELFTESFTIDKLIFTIGNQDQKPLLTGLHYDNIKFNFKKKDTLQTSLTGFEITQHESK